MLDIKKQETILIAIGIALIGLIIGYNAFYIASAGQTVVVNTDSTQEEAYTPNAAEGADNTVIADESNKININTADVTELEQLSGIGESKAQAIINYREENGDFSSIEEIKEVKGIGAGIFENIKDMITV